jgi:hypothetical protein
MRQILQLAVVFFATIFMKFTAPVVGLIYKTNDAIIIEGETLNPYQHSIILIVFNLQQMILSNNPRTSSLAFQSYSGIITATILFANHSPILTI